MIDPTASILSDRAQRQHVLSARPDAPTVPDRPRRHHGDAVRRATVTALRGLADRLEPARGLPAEVRAS